MFQSNCDLVKKKKKKNFKCEIWNFSIDGQIVTILEVPFAVVMLAVRQLQVAFAVSTLDNYCN